MQNEELRSYVASERARGVHEEDIKSALLAKGWKEEDVTDSMSSVSSSHAPTPSGEIIPAWDLLRSSFTEMTDHFPLIVSIVGGPVLLMGLMEIARIYGVPQYSMIFIGSGILAVVGGILSILATIGLMKQMRAGWGLDVRTTYAHATPYFWSVLWVSVITGMAVLGGALLLLVPAIIVGVMMSFARPIVVLEGKKGMEALTMSARLVSGYWGAVLWRFIVVGLASMLITIVLSIIPYFGVLASLLTLPLATIYTVRLYDALKVAHPDTSAAPDRRGLFMGLAYFGVFAIFLIFAVGAWGVMRYTGFM